MGTLELEEKTYRALSELQSNIMALNARITSHEDRIMEIQAERKIFNTQYNQAYFELCVKVGLDPKQSHNIVLKPEPTKKT